MRTGYKLQVEVASNGIACFLLPTFPSPPDFPCLSRSPISSLTLHLLFSGSFLAEPSFRITLFAFPQARVIPSPPIRARACPHPNFCWHHLVLGQIPLEWLHQESGNLPWGKTTGRESAAWPPPLLIPSGPHFAAVMVNGKIPTPRAGSVPLSSRTVVAEMFSLGCPALSCCASAPIRA